MSHNETGRPGEKAAHSKNIAAGDTPSISPIPHDWEQLACHINGAFVALVETTQGRHRRRVYLTLAAAENAVRRAEDAGHQASIVLSQLQSVCLVEGSASDAGRLHVVSAGGVA